MSENHFPFHQATVFRFFGCRQSMPTSTSQANRGKPVRLFFFLTYWEEKAQKPWEQAARAALRKSDLSVKDSNVVAMFTEHRWHLTERSPDAVEAAPKGSCRKEGMTSTASIPGPQSCCEAGEEETGRRAFNPRINDRMQIQTGGAAPRGSSE